MKVIDLLNDISKGKIQHGAKFRIDFGGVYRDFYYDAYEPCALYCLRCESDDSPLEDDISFNDEVVSLLTPQEKIEKAIFFIKHKGDYLGEGEFGNDLGYNDLTELLNILEGVKNE